MMSAAAALKAYIAYLESLTPDDLAALDTYVNEEVRFKDPFNDVRGVEAMGRILTDMFETLGQVRFRCDGWAVSDDLGYFSWVLEGRLRAKPWQVAGTTRVRLGEDGRVVEHIDYWDAAGGLYEKLPVIGPILAALRRRVAVR